jgi:hypothetical protein
MRHSRRRATQACLRQLFFLSMLKAQQRCLR